MELMTVSDTRGGCRVSDPHLYLSSDAGCHFALHIFTSPAGLRSKDLDSGWLILSRCFPR